jgi:prepilin-type N-terminal cleavage/methylation domain-containing protein
MNAPHTNRSASGMTVVELMVVLVIAGVLLTLAVPGMGEYFATQRLKGSTEELSADLQFARMTSVQRNAAVTFTMAANGYSIAQGATTIKSVSLTSGSSISAGSTMVASFDPVRATATITNGPSVTLANAATSRTLRVTLGVMGRVGICSPSGTVRGYEAC